ncbi:hypothetical protein GJR96_14800 [Haloferax sp. MBLA0076]|uniref:Uncharacterized protein n=1 Tax=Haloferax litoreum TaxID=2666140 RepID=A0A6A8GK39_9EURY|nr:MULTISPECIES: hypothetical protein [Haloferax]KAB1194641.1 hypothetical protein Hfx1148_14730 [Haloferax sp. CBA1148]MRX23219.1 hypothetical protein [Haloferax litoreum]
MSVLSEVRTGRRAELALVVATLVGLVAASFHWTGLVVGGILVGLLATSVRRAVVQGLTFGGVALGVHVARLWWHGALDPFFQTGLILVLTVGIGFGLPTVAAIGARAIVDDV